MDLNLKSYYENLNKEAANTAQGTSPEVKAKGTEKNQLPVVEVEKNHSNTKTAGALTEQVSSRQRTAERVEGLMNTDPMFKDLTGADREEMKKKLIRMCRNARKFQRNQVNNQPPEGHGPHYTANKSHYTDKNGKFDEKKYLKDLAKDPFANALKDKLEPIAEAQANEDVPLQHTLEEDVSHVVNIALKMNVELDSVKEEVVLKPVGDLPNSGAADKPLLELIEDKPADSKPKLDVKVRLDNSNVDINSKHGQDILEKLKIDYSPPSSQQSAPAPPSTQGKNTAKGKNNLTQTAPSQPKKGLFQTLTSILPSQNKNKLTETLPSSLPSAQAGKKPQKTEPVLSSNYKAMSAAVLTMAAKPEGKELAKAITGRDNTLPLETDVYTMEKINANDLKTMNNSELLHALVNGDSVNIDGNNIPVALLVLNSIHWAMKPSDTEILLKGLVSEFINKTDNPDKDLEKKLNILKFFNGWAEKYENHPGVTKELNDFIEVAKEDDNKEIREMGQVLGQNFNRVKTSVENLVTIGKPGDGNIEVLLKGIRSGSIKPGSKEYNKLVKDIGIDLSNVKSTIVKNYLISDFRDTSNKTESMARLSSFEEKLKSYMNEQILGSTSGKANDKDSAKEAARMIAFFAEVAHSQVTNGDFDTSASIFLHLTGAVEVRRLTSIIDNAQGFASAENGKKTKDTWSALEKLFDFSNNFGNLRTEISRRKANLAANPQRIIPYITLSAKAFTATHDGNPSTFNTFSGTPENFSHEKRINLGKLNLMKKVQDEISDAKVGIANNPHQENVTNIGNQVMDSKFKPPEEYDKISKELRDKTNPK
jgi:hypothetical protein